MVRKVVVLPHPEGREAGVHPTVRRTDAFDRHDVALVDHEVIDFNVMLTGMFCHTLLGFPSSTSSCNHLPGQRLPGVHGNDGTVALWYHPGRFFKLDDTCGWLKVIDTLRVVGYEGLQPVQSVVLLEQLDQTRQSDGCREHACRTATAFFGGLRMWCRVAPEHQFRMGTQRCREQRVTVFWAFGKRFAKEMRLQEPASDII